MDSVVHDDAIVSVEPQREAIVFTLRAGAAFPSEVQPGTVLFAGARRGRPFMRRVKAITEEPEGRVRVTTEPAPLTEVFRELRVRRRGMKVSFEELAATQADSKMSGALTSQDVFSKTMACDRTFSALGGALEFGVRDCSLTTALTLNSDITVSDGTIDRFYLTVEGNLDLVGAFYAELDYAMSKEGSDSIFRVPLPVVNAGVLGIVIDLGVDVGYDVSFDTKAEVSAGFTFHASAELGVELVGDKMELVENRDSGGAFEAVEADLTGSGRAEAYVRPYVGLSLDANLLLVSADAGVSIGAKAYAYAQFGSLGGCKDNVTADGPTATTGIGYEVGVGVAADVGVDASAKVFFIEVADFDKTWNLASIEWPLLTGVVDLPLGKECCTNAGCYSDGPCRANGQCVAGACEYSQLPSCCTADDECDDGKFCTQDVCHAGQCEHTFRVNACSCDAHADCDDGDPCTTNRCTDQGKCRFVSKAGCVPCKSDGDCVDESVCTVGKCTPNGTCNFSRNKLLQGCCVTVADCATLNACSSATCQGFECIPVCAGPGGSCDSDCCTSNDDCPKGTDCFLGLCGGPFGTSSP